MWVAGIDLSTHSIDVVMVDIEGADRVQSPTWDRFDLDGPASFDRARSVRDSVPGRTDGYWDEVLAVGIEDPRGQGAGHIYRVQGAVLSCLPSSILVEPWIPSKWRKAVGLSGRATKLDIILWGCERLGHTHDKAPRDAISINGFSRQWSSDGYDALGIALATRQAIERQAA